MHNKNASNHAALPSALILAGILWLLVAFAGLASASELDEAGYRGFSFPSGTGGNSAPTGEDPESKLWWNDGFWWGSLWSSSGNAYHIHRLDLASQSWVDTGLALDDRFKSRADMLWDGTHLYAASHFFVLNAGQPAVPEERGRLYRYSYDSGTKTYSLDPGFPVEITGGKSETLVLAKDSQGQLWVTYVENQQVMVNHSLNGDDRAWGQPFVLPVGEAANVTSDDISSIIAYSQHVGVMWSNQNNPRTVYFAAHPVGAPGGVWTGVRAFTRSSDDHINLKQLETDNAGNVFAVVKTSRAADLVTLLVCRNDLDHCKTESDWMSYQVYDTNIYSSTRPHLLIDTGNRYLYVFTRNMDAQGNFAIYYKRSKLDGISFPVGIGTPFIKSTVDTNINDPTSTKQNLNASTGLLVLASDGRNKVYLHNYLSLEPEGPPVFWAYAPIVTRGIPVQHILSTP